MILASECLTSIKNDTKIPVRYALMNKESTVCVIKIFHDLNEYNSTNMPDINKIPFD